MNSQILFEVQKVLKQRKVDAAFLAVENAKRALENKEIAVLDARRKELIQLAAVANFEKRDASALRAERKQVEEKENALLASLGLNISDFETQVFCPKCADSGFVKGKLCSCAKNIASKMLLEASGFEHALASFESSDFSLFGEQSEELKKMYGKMQAWTAKPDSDIRTILLYGKSGTGKTFLLECMAKSLIDHGNFVFFTTSFHLVQTCLKYHTVFDSEKTGLLEPFLECDVLFIDDLGAEPMLKNVTTEYLLMILNQRMVNNKRTVISTNLYLEQVEERFDERVFSRIFNKRNGIAIHMQGGDLRFKKNSK